MAAETPSLDTIFCAAVEVASADERAAYIARTCGDDRDLQARVEKLVDAHFRAGSFLNQPAQAPGDTGPFLSPSLERSALTERPGAVIGPYKLLQQIGEGGMGAVFMAEQTSPVQRKVALKLIKPGMDSSQVVARFEAERQALALMDHPNIAKVYDGGATEAGRPYFVMELVKGMPITKYCDEHRLTPRQRLELFVPVCQAVQHAHQKGVIHRDLKPTNVLAAAYDGRPVPKVIDFGVAKAAGPKLTERTLFTAFGSVVGTLEYMSPEQAELNQLDVDTRSDVYSLGVMLYELLTGTTPLERKRLKDTGLVEALRIIREEEPPRPSVRLSTTDELPAVAASRGLEPKKLGGAIRGELDWIVMKALEKDRGRRYETANGLAADAIRYLNDEPVLACPPSAWYRFHKFTRRNRGGLAAAAVLGLALLVAVGAVASSLGWVARDQEARRAKLSGQVELILSDVTRLEREQKWQQALAAAERAEATLAGGEADDATRERVREVLRDLECVAELDRIRQGRRVGYDPRVAQDYARAFREYGVDVEQLPTETAVAALRARPTLVPPFADALDEWIDSQLPLVAGEPSWEPLLAVARGLDPDPLRDRLRAAWGRKITAESQGELRRLAESIDVKAQSPATLVVLARTLIRSQLPDAAVRILRDGQDAYSEDFWLNFELADRLFAGKDYLGALRYYSICVGLRPDAAVTHMKLGDTLRRQGKLDEAVGCYRKAILVDPKFHGPYLQLGVALADQGKLDEAVATFQKALALFPKSPWIRGNLGFALSQQGKLDEAVAECRKTIEMMPQNSPYAPAHLYLGIALHKQWKLDEAVAEYRKAIECQKAIPLLDENGALAHYDLGLATHNQGKLDEAVAEYRKAITLKPDYPEAHCNLGRALRQQGEFRQAVEELRRGHELGSKNPNWRAPSAEWVRQCERLVGLDGKLPGFLEGKATPASSDERVELAELCYLKHLNGAAARFYAKAFVAEPKLADDLGAAHRYNAACAAALAGCGVGKDADKFDEKEKARLRGQALGWLQADLESWTKEIVKNTPETRTAVREEMKHWQTDADLAGVRGLEALAKLPEAERQPWQKLWDDAADTLAQAKTTPEKKSGPK